MSVPPTTSLRCALILLAAATMTLARAQDDPGRPERLRTLQAAGRAAPLLLYPVRVLERPDPRVAEALGLVLERFGLPDLELAAAAFAPAAGTAWADVPAAFAAHRRAEPAQQPRYALYAEFLGTPRTGPTEVRFVVLDPAGDVVLQDRQVPGDADWKRTAARDPDPLGCATLVAERLFRLAAWTKAPGSVPEAKFARRWRERSGVPAEAELAAMQKRAAALRDGLDKARIAVLPTLAGGAHDAASSERLVALLRDGSECQATAVPGRQLPVAPTPNEQKRLWDLLRALQAEVRERPVDADYVLVADIGLDPTRRSGYVHLAICTAQGEFVVADFVNDQHPLFASRQPKTLEQAEQLAAARLRELWR